MKITTRFKADLVCPCPLQRKEDGERAWEWVRGQAVTLVGPASGKKLKLGDRCGSDQYWFIEASPLIREMRVALGLPVLRNYTACRHVLEIGD